MMRYIFLTFLLVFIAAPLQAREMGIAVIVNEDPITFTELEERYRLILASSRIPDSPKTRARLMPQIVSAMIDEQLQFQEGTRSKLKVSQSEINNGFATIAQQNKLSADEFRNALRRSGINLATIERQIEAQIMWSKVVGRQLRSKVNVSDNDIDTVEQRLNNNIGKTEYLTSEIFLPVERTADEPQVKELAYNLTRQMKAGQAQFFRVAQQFSKAPGAPQGGDLGWVQEGQLANELDQALLQMEPKTISEPIRSLGGYHILLLRNTREITPETIPAREQIRSSIGMQRLDRLQQRLLMDLKSAAFIENRLGS